MYSIADQIPPSAVLSGFDICIAGAGAAGIALAMRLLSSARRVLVLESGEPTDAGAPDPVLESIYAGALGPFTTKVDPIFLQRSRLNMYGGTTNHFWFFARPMEAIDLEPRAGYRDAHWPLNIEELNRYYPDANLFGNYGPFNYDDIPFWSKLVHGTPFPPVPGDQLRPLIWHGQENAAMYQFQTQFGPQLLNAGNITVLFNANVIGINATENRDHVNSLACSTIESGKPGRHFTVNAPTYILALGGIEPVRLLKLSGNLGDNARGHLGRGFMLHPLIWNAARIQFPTAIDEGIQNFFRMQPVTLKVDESGKHLVPVTRHLYSPRDMEKAISFWAWGMLGPTPEALRREQIGNFHSAVQFTSNDEITLSMNWESVRNENSTITLDESATDPVLGQAVARVDWNLQESEKRTIIKGLELARDYFLARNASKFEITTDLSGGPDHWTFSPDQSNLAGLQTGDHHMGALRMSEQPEDGIVDPNCKIHTIDNLYIAGSGVYPTSGHTNPTLTIVALALRLADHLKAL